jgi:hypothetical protein
MYGIIKTSVDGISKLLQCLKRSLDTKEDDELCSCDLWDDKHAIVCKAITVLCFWGRVRVFAIGVGLGCLQILLVSMALLLPMFLSLPPGGPPGASSIDADMQ